MLPIDLPAIIKLIGYPGIFAIVFLESGVFFGFFLPGASMLFTAGLLASQGFFNPWILVPMVAVAAILGDNTGYWFGNKIGIKLYERAGSKWFRPEHLHRAKIFYETHGVLAIVLARFVPIIRTFAPIVAGIASMRYSLFVFYNIVGALLWGSGVTFIGYYLGAKIPAIETFLTPIIGGIIIVTLIPLAWNAYKASKTPSV